MEEGLQYNGEKVEGFSAKCGKCESSRVSIGYEFNYYGGLTGWDHSLWVECLDCQQRKELSI